MAHGVIATLGCRPFAPVTDCRPSSADSTGGARLFSRPFAPWRRSDSAAQQPYWSITCHSTGWALSERRRRTCRRTCGRA